MVTNPLKTTFSSASIGGPLRHQQSSIIAEFNIRNSEKLSATSRNLLMCTMCILGDPGEVFILTHTYQLFGETTSQVLCIDPVTLETRYSSPRLPGGPFWPGGFAIHADGSIIVVYGKFIHKLSRKNCEVLASLELPIHQPYNRSVFLSILSPEFVPASLSWIMVSL
jgi:hypothetical protein